MVWICPCNASATAAICATSTGSRASGASAAPGQPAAVRMVGPHRPQGLRGQRGLLQGVRESLAARGAEPPARERGAHLGTLRAPRRLDGAREAGRGGATRDRLGLDAKLCLHPDRALHEIASVLLGQVAIPLASLVRARRTATRHCGPVRLGSARRRDGRGTRPVSGQAVSQGVARRGRARHRRSGGRPGFLNARPLTSSDPSHRPGTMPAGEDGFGPRSGVPASTLPGHQSDRVEAEGSGKSGAMIRMSRRASGDTGVFRQVKIP